MKSGLRFHRFLERSKFNRRASRSEISRLDDFPDYIRESIHKEWSHCFSFRGECDWDSMVSDAASRVVTNHPFVLSFRFVIQDLISKF